MSEDGILRTWSSAVLHAGKMQDDRRRALDSFKKGDVRFLISTDVAARGIDIESLPHVVSTRCSLYAYYNSHEARLHAA